MFVRYLRRKPGRGLAIIYTVNQVNSAHQAGVNDPNLTVSLTLDEQALNGTHIRFNAEQISQAPLEISPAGVLRIPELGLAVQKFPTDASLPALAASCDTTPHSPLWHALQRAAQAQLHDEEWQLTLAKADPVRYKPASRCVIRYHLQLEQTQSLQPKQKTLMIFGKVYADPEKAGRVQLLQQQLYEEQANASDLPLLPRPLGILASLGLTFHEAIEPPTDHFLGQEPHASAGGGL